MAELDPKLQADCQVVAHMPLSWLLLMLDANYPWFILVPDRADVSEIFQLDAADQQQLVRESSRLARAMSVAFGAHKMNVAALGNMVPQLHVHHIARYRDDPAWPAPVWGRVAAVPYTETERKLVIERLRSRLGDDEVVYRV